ncbi:MAG TPA: protoporphyrinogen oxidase, partial [Bacteroidales bacterium]|nr:protoporphyrinogen oxidase [Bacteroidales bacterium]
MENITEKDVIVIGAGLTGLTASYYLKRSGKNFLTLEKAPRTGGVIHSVKENGFVYEEGPNTGVIGNPEVAELFEHLNNQVTPEYAGEEVKKRYVLKNEKWEQLPTGLMQAIRTPLFTLKDKLRILGEPFRRPGRNPNESLAELVNRRLGKSFLDYAIDPFILGVYAGDPSMLVPKYALPKLYRIEQQYGSFIGGSVKKMFEKKDERNRKATRQVFSVKGGLSNLTEALYRESGSEKFLLDLREIKVKPMNGKFHVTVKQAEDKELKFIAGRVITTVGAYELPNILPFISKAQLDRITTLYYTRVNEIVLGFDNWEGIPLDGFGGLVPHRENQDILGVLFMSSFLKDRAPQNGALLSVFMGGVRKPELADLSDDEIVSRLRFAFKKLMGLREFNPDLIRIKRHRYAIPQYGADSGERFAAVEQIELEHHGLF